MSLHQIIFTVLTMNVIWIWAFYVACKVEFRDDDNPQLGVEEKSKMLLWKVKVWAVKKFGWFYSKPICTCPACMSSLHSVPFFLPMAIGLSSQFPEKSAIGLTMMLGGLWIMYMATMLVINFFLGLIVSKLEE